jgi:hypothetical protein
VGFALVDMMKSVLVIFAIFIVIVVLLLFMKVLLMTVVVFIMVGAMAQMSEIYAPRWKACVREVLLLR